MELTLQDTGYAWEILAELLPSWVSREVLLRENFHLQGADRGFLDLRMGWEVFGVGILSGALRRTSRGSVAWEKAGSTR